MTKQIDIPKPTHSYVGRDKGGCCLMIISDLGDKWTGQAVSKAIRDGLTIDRIDWETYVNVVSKEPTFMKCGCKVELIPEQLIFEAVQ